MKGPSQARRASAAAASASPPLTMAPAGAAEVAFDLADWAAAEAEVEEVEVTAEAVDKREVVTGAVAVDAAEVVFKATLEEEAETASETGPWPIALADGTGTGVPLRAAFWYQSAPKRSGTQLEQFELSGERRSKQAGAKRTEHPIRAA